MKKLTLRLGMSTTAKVIRELGEFETLQDAHAEFKKLMEQLKSDVALQNEFGINESFYWRVMTSKEHKAEYIDYGSHSRFVVIEGLTDDECKLVPIA